MKRIFDLFGSFFGLLFLAPVLILISIKIRLESPGSAVYRGLRLGRNGRPFYIYKFRTMYEISESYQGPPLVADGDWRITPFGAWLRRTKLNEIPQLWNVLKGEMSLVGPRPEDPRLAQAWPQDALAETLSMRPGITSPASVLYRNEPQLWMTLLERRNGLTSGERMFSARPETEQLEQELLQWYSGTHLAEKIQLDLLYIRQRTLWLDMQIIAWTVSVFLKFLDDTTPEFLRGWLVDRQAGGQKVGPVTEIYKP